MWRRTATAMLLLGGASAAFAANEGASAQQPARWLFDPQARCYVFHADSRPADAVMWSGGCADRTAEGSGTATFLLNGHFAQAISGTFAGGVAAGEARIVWADGAHFEGAMRSGRPDRKIALATASDSPQAAAQNLQPNGETPHADDSRRTANAPPLQILPATAKSAVSQSATAKSAPAVVLAPASWLDAFKGQKLIAVDGTALSISPSGNGIALTAPPGGAVASGYLMFLNGSQGLVTDGPGAEKFTGLFQIGDAALTIDYASGGTEVLSRAGEGGLAIATSSGPALTCSIWYPEGHVFSTAEREAAVAAYASRLGVHAGLSATASCGGAPRLQADSSPETSNAPARAVRSHHAATGKTAMSANAPEISAEPVTVRASDVHPIDGAVSIPAPEAQSALNFRTADEPVASPRSPSQCLSVEADGADVGFRNHCGFEVQFAWCVVDASDPTRLCGSGAPVGGVTANGFGPLFAERDPQDPEHEFRWIACGGARGDVLPKLVRTDPPAGQCLRMRAS